MKKITLLLFLFVTSWQINAQTCTQTFTATGQDDDPTVLTINAVDITCYGANPLTSLKLTNSAGSLTSGFCTSGGTSWYGFDLSIDGGTAITGCAADFNDVNITGFTTLTITSHDDDVYSDGVTITIDVEATFTALTPPSCTALTTPANGATGVSSTVISWPTATGGVTGYRLNVGTTPGGTNVLNNFDVGNVLTYDLVTLISGTTYYVTVIPYNVNGSATACSETSFATCGAVTVFPWTENFDALATGTNVFPSCWAYENITSNWSISTTPVANSGANSLRRTWSTDGWAFTPLATLTGGTSYTFSYYMRTNDAVVGYDVTLGVGNAQTSAAMSTTLTTQTGYQGPAWTLFTAYFTPTISGNYSFGIHVAAPFAPNGINFDDFKLEVSPSCLNPLGLAVSAVTDASATVTWTATTGNYEYVLDNTAADPAGSGTTLSGETYNAISLSPTTIYYFHVRSVCAGPTYSAWSTVSFTTACAPVTAFVENFDSVTAPSFPNCWGRVGTGGNANIQTTNPSSGINTMYLYGFSGSLGVVKTVPVSNLGLGTHRLNFKMRGNFTAGDDVEIGYLTNPNDSNTFLSLGSVNAASLVYEDYTFTPPAGSYSNYLAFRHTGTIGASVLIDDVVWEPIPACSNPSGLAVSAVTSSSATIMWTATTGNYEYVLDNAVANPSGSGTTLSGETYNATLLSPSTTYYFHVRSVCAGPIYSTWSTVSFTTPATPPGNDSCSSPILLTLGAVFVDQDIDTTNTGATLSAETPSPSCGTTGFATTGKDVWYNVVVPPSGTLTIETDATAAGTGLLIDTVISIYSGTCGVLTELDCDDFSGNTTTPAGADYAKVSLTGQLPGATLLIRAFGWNGLQGNFSISAYDASLSTPSFDINGFSAYPNPVKDVLNLSYTKEISNVSVHNLLGQEVMTKSINATQTKIDMSNLSNGTYLVKVTVDGLVKTLKVVKQ
ncbi:T9SS type A sorting domain-containing protein [Flavobacterium sp.]|uniref:T9SS type A sorting domain-containing protein n=1 Tax=Flavobacterium sp. TaxID=239 RepID=UPI00375263BE